MSREPSFYEKPMDNALRRITKEIINVIVILVLALFISRYVGAPFKITGHSMEPTLMSEDRVLVNRISNNMRKIKRFELVLFQVDGEQTTEYVKRVVALPGETIQIKDGIIYINNEAIDMGSLDKILQPGLAQTPITLGNDEYFVLGDNSTGSEDSRYSNIGNVKRSQIQGIVWFRFYPFSNIGKIEATQEK
jgi:signal peptidase I